MFKVLIAYCLTFLLVSATKLQFSSDTHTFKLMQFTDLHFNIIDSFIENHIIMRNLMDYVKPGIVVVTGDAISAPCLFNPKIPTFISKICWDHVAHQFKQKHQPYCVALGNHDCEVLWGVDPQKGRAEFLDQDITRPYSFTKKNDPSVAASSTYQVPIQSSSDANKVALILWIFDTGDTGCMGIKEGRGCVEKDAIEWFLRTDKELREKYGEQYIALAFAHIPPPEFQIMQNTSKIYGHKDDGVSCPRVNSGFVDALISRKVKGLFVGHNHDNDFGGFYNGIELAFGRKTGYNFVDRNKRPQGARVFEVKEDEITKEVTYMHYIVEKSGKIVENGEAYYRTDKLGPC